MAGIYEWEQFEVTRNPDQAERNVHLQTMCWDNQSGADAD